MTVLQDARTIAQIERRLDAKIAAGVARAVAKARADAPVVMPATVQSSGSSVTQVPVVPDDGDGAVLYCQNVTGSTLLAGQRVIIEYYQHGAFIVGFAHVHHALDLVEQRVLTATSASETFTLPTGYRHLRFVIVAMATGAAVVGLSLRHNGNSGAIYDYQLNYNNAGAMATLRGAAGTSGYAGLVGAAAGWSVPAVSVITLFDYASAAASVFGPWQFHGTAQESAADFAYWGGGATRASVKPLTTMQFFPGAGSFAAGAVLEMIGMS